MVVYVRRDAQGRIVAVSESAHTDHDESLPHDAAEVQAFFGSMNPDESGTGQDQLANSDLRMVRVLEDLIDLLVDKAVIRFTDLPEAAQSKLLARRNMRHSIRSLNLLDDDALI